MKHVFDHDVMSQYLSAEDVSTITSSQQLSDAVRQRFADALLRWAYDNGVTRYCHWFQPLTGGSACKLDTFINYDTISESLLNVSSSRTSSVMQNPNECCSGQRSSASEISKDSGCNGNCDSSINCRRCARRLSSVRDASVHCVDKTVLRFPASCLLRGEADASSFPSGTARHTHEARGYTLWDADSTIFIRDGTLHIPAVFCTPDGSALDDRTPLLRSIEYLKTQVKTLLSKFGVKAHDVEVNLGVEQEFFLIPIQLYRKRLDLVSCGCTLFGDIPPKTQQLQDQYFGVLKSNVRAFLEDVNLRLERLGVHVKTEHNEVAPSQHEVVVLYSSAEKATDQNMLVMETLRDVANKHSLACLLHEKPFFGINGSGKHCNWSISADGVQLLALPDSKNIQHGQNNELGKHIIGTADPDINQVQAISAANTSNDTSISPNNDSSSTDRFELTREVFLTIFTAVIVAVKRHADLLQVSAATCANQRRLGGHEAPPAVISVFTGKPMEKLLRRVQTSTPNSPVLEMNVSGIQNTKIEASDRNRTSPFAFTGNKFEFRMPGSSQNVAFVNTVINTITGSVLGEISEHIGHISPSEIPMQIVDILQPYINEAMDIIFNGDGYSQQWKDEMYSRGLYKEDDICKLYDMLVNQENIDLFTKARVMSIKELEIKHSVLIDRYKAELQIELDCLLQMSKKYITGFTTRQLQFNNELVAGLSADNVPSNVLKYREDVSNYLQRLNDFEVVLNDKPMNNIKKVIQAREQLVSAINVLESQTDKSIWTIPDYSDILYYNAE